MLYGNDPLAPMNKVNPNKNQRYSKTKVENVKFYPSPDFTANETLKNEIKPKHMAFLNASARISDEYSSMRNNYLNKRSFGYY